MNTDEIDKDQNNKDNKYNSKNKKIVETTLCHS